MYYPAIITAAIFMGIILNDVISSTTGHIPEHALTGLICVVGMAWLSAQNAEIVAWGLVMIPLFILGATFVLSVFKVNLVASSAPAAAPAAPAPAASMWQTAPTGNEASSAASSAAPAYSCTPAVAPTSNPAAPAAAPAWPVPSGAAGGLTPAMAC